MQFVLLVLAVILSIVSGSWPPGGFRTGGSRIPPRPIRQIRPMPNIPSPYFNKHSGITKEMYDRGIRHEWL
jgi:hypothetical protein